MKEEDDLFDDFLRKKGNEANIQFEENDWIMANELVTNNRLKSKKRKRFILLFFALLFMVFISAVTYNYVMKANAENISNIKSNISTYSFNTKANKTPEKASSKSNTTNQSESIKINQLIVNVNEEKSIDDNKKEKKKDARKKYKKYKRTSLKTKNKNQKIDDTDFLETKTISPFEKVNLLKEQEDDYFLFASKPLSKLNLLLVLCDTCIKQKDYQLLKKQKQLAQQQLWLEAGITFYNPTNSGFQNFGYYAGIKYQYFLSAKTFLSGGVYFSSISQNQKERITTQKTYGFGLNEVTKNIQTTRLDYLEVPLTFGYFLAPKHSLQLGVSFLYVLQSYETLKTTQNSELNKEKTTYLNGYRYHLNDIDLQIALSYQYYLNKNWNINTGFYYGFTKVTAIDNNNIGSRFGAAYKF